LIKSVAQQFSTSITQIESLGNGLINDTYLVSTELKPFVLQRINKQVFTQPEQIMVNLIVLNQHVEQISDKQITLKIPQLLPTLANNTFFCDEQDDVWRALSYIDNTESLETISNLAQAEQVGYALGQFHWLTRNLDAEKLHDTLPGFHIAPGYLNHYQYVKPQTKIPEDPYHADFIDGFQHIVNELEAAKGQGLLTLRVIHGDPKLNNFLFDKNSQRVISIIDLDTVKPGLIHYDIGDCLRSCCHNMATDEFNLEICHALLRGYIEKMGAFLSKSDYQFLYPAIRLIPFELGLRFYCDYLEGNRYFKVADLQENLCRATGQFRLCASVMAQEAEIKDIIKHLQSSH
jgi:Ser/Thr protein kinase RdoA (MazF antagonist)